MPSGIDRWRIAGVVPASRRYQRAVGWRKPCRGQINSPEWRLYTTTKATLTFVRNSPLPNIEVSNGFLPKDRSDPNNVRPVTRKSTVPTLGNFARGDRVFAVNPRPGHPEHWVCTQSGIISSDAFTTSSYLLGNVFLEDGKV